MKKIKIKMTLALFLVFLFVMFYFIPSQVNASGYNNKIWFEEGDEITLVGIDDEAMLTISGADYDFTSVEWRSKDSDIVSVDDNGNILAVGAGSTYIYATAIIEEDDSEKATSSTASPSAASIRVASSNEATPSVPHKTATARCKVIVEVPVSGFEILMPNLTLEHKKATKLLTFNVEPNDASNRKIYWESSNEDVATVSSKGKVTAISEGTSVITGETNDGSFSDSCNITVEFSNTATPSEAIMTIKNVVDDDWEYIKQDGKITITGYKGTDLDIVIPEEIEGMLVTSIQDGAFINMGITSVIMPDTITHIGNSVFSGCDNLTDVRLSDNLKILPWHTFADCVLLQNIELPKFLEEMDSSAFYYTTIKELFIPEFVKKINLDYHLPYSITKYKVHPDNQYFKSDDDGLLLNKVGDTLYCYPIGNICEEDVIKLPDSISHIVNLHAIIRTDYRVSYDVFLGNKITSIDNTTDLSKKYDFIWADPNSYIYKTLRVNNVAINPAKESEFDEIMSSGFKVAFKDDNTIRVKEYNGDSNIMNVPSYFGSIKVTALDNNLFYNESVGTIIIPETFQEIISHRPGMGYEWSLDRCRNIHKIVNNSSYDIPFRSYYHSNSRGWYNQEFSGGIRLEKIPANSTVYKHYGIYYGGIQETEKYSLVDNYGYNEEFKLLPPPSKSGRTFVGWKINMKPGSIDGGFITSIPSGTNDNVFVYAVYERNTSSSSGGGGGSSSGVHKISTSSSQNTHGTWKQDEHGWWFQKQDGSYPKDEWIMNNNIWYRFDQNGYMQSGWVEVNKVKYYLNPDGAMVSNDWVLQDGKWYFFNESGAMMQNRWVKWKDKWYYLNADGSMVSNTVTPDGYKIDSNGVWVE